MTNLTQISKASTYRKGGSLKVLDNYGPMSIYHLDTWRRDVTAYYWPKLKHDPELLAKTVHEVCMRNKNIVVDKQKHLDACRRAACWKPKIASKPFVKDDNVIQMYLHANRKREREAKDRIMVAKYELEIERPGLFISNKEIAKRAGSHQGTVAKVLKVLTSSAGGCISRFKKSLLAACTVVKDLSNRLIDPPREAVKSESIHRFDTSAGLSHISEVVKNLVKGVNYVETG